MGFETTGKKEGGESPYKPEVVAHMLRERGPVRPEDPQHGGLHGTSLEAVQVLLSRGVLIGRQMSREFDYEPGDISLYPTPQLDLDRHALATHMIQDFMRNPEDSRGHAEFDAQANAQRHAFLNDLHLPWSNNNLYQSRALLESYLLRDDVSAVDERMEYENAVRFFREQQISEEALLNQAQTVQELKGFLLGIDPSVQEDSELRLMPGDPRDVDVRIRTFGKGLSYRYISGIEPLGPVETAFLDSLRQNK